MWEYCGMARDEEGLKKALVEIPKLRKEFWSDVNVLGESGSLNQNLENAGRVADFLEFAELFAYDALYRTESCGGHYRVESATEEGEAARKDEEFSHAAAWFYRGPDMNPILYKDELEFENVKLTQRSYK